ncbi:MAG: hypothetical protein KF744_14805 [Taibaiella sp.]|nr:hypothetical protein [Taibaiella sp.]
MELLVRISGVLLVALALLHVGFPRYFRWTEDLAPLSLINRQMMYVHTFFVALTVLLMGGLAAFYPSGFFTPFGGVVSLMFAVFWFVRLLFQLFGYSSALWRGKRFETTVHIVFLFLWSFLSALYFMVFLSVHYTKASALFD